MEPMSALDMLMRMWPAYLLGFSMVALVVMSGNKDLMSVSRPHLVKWCKFLGIITLIRLVGFGLMWKEIAPKLSDVSWLPWETCTMVWWEDMAHVMPLLLLGRLIGTSKKTWPIHGLALAALWFTFGIGHVYQGIPSAIFISLYVPYMWHLSKRLGLGTIMIGHVMYDLATILLIKAMLGFM